MTANQPTPSNFERQILDRLDKIDDDLRGLDNKIERQGQRLDNIFNGLIIGLGVTVISASLLILARNAFELWIVYHPPGT